MKKTYLSALIIGLTSTLGFSQSVQKQNLSNKFSTAQPTPAPSVYTPKILGTQIWSDNFDTPGNWTIDNDGQTGPTFGWNINATSQSWWSSGGITGTGGNYAELSNGNPTATPATQVIDVEYTMTTGPLDVMSLSNIATGSSTSEVILQFKEFGAKFYDDQRVQISTDGTSFTTVRDNSAYSQLTSTGGAAYPNPATVTVNIAPYISGNPTNVYIRFSWTSQFPTNVDPNAWVAYGWFIDDVALFTKPTNDLVAKPYFWGTQGLTYYQIPTTQVAPIEFAARAINDGATTQTDVTLNVAIPSASYVGTSPAGIDILVNEEDTLDVSTTFTPPATVASYPTTWNITQNETDDVAPNNTLAPFTFQVTNFTYASDNNVASSTTSNGGLAYKLGALYDIWNDQNLYGIDVKLNSATQNGSIIRGVIYAVDYSAGTGWTYTEVASSDYHDIVPADKVGFLTLPLTSQYALSSTQVTYMAAIETDGNGGAGNDVVVACAQETDIQIGFQDENGDWYQGFTPKTNAPMIRMNFNVALGLDENEAVNGLSVYPNPATDNVSIDFNLANASDVTIEVVDATGKVVIAKSLASQSAGATNVSFDTNALNSGVYFVNIATEAGKATQKFIKK